MFRAGGDSAGGGKWDLITTIYNTNQTYTVPVGAKNNEFHIRIFGGGGDGRVQFSDDATGTAGAGGWMNFQTLTLTPGEAIPITIGKNGSSGGTTSFGTYLSANGGEGYSIGYTWSSTYAASGGSGAGAIRMSNRTSFPCTNRVESFWKGGNGYQFGGGGVIGYANAANANNGCFGGTYFGSIYGGGNGAISNIHNSTNSKNSENGVNTISIIDESDTINADGIGYGQKGSGLAAGGGGYGANGGNGPAGGGGGYGKAGYGGDGVIYNYNHAPESKYYSYIAYVPGGGGSYGHGATYNKETATYGGGGSGCGSDSIYSRGASGICIIQYYAKTE